MSDFKKLFKYTPTKNYNFELQPDIYCKTDEIEDNQTIYSSIDFNLKFINKIYNVNINSDIVIRDFSLTARDTVYKAFLVYIDGMVDSDLINRFVLNPLMLRNSSNTFNGPLNQEVTSQLLKNSIKIKKSNKFDLEEYIYSNLMPQNSVDKNNTFSKIIQGINIGNCALFVDTINTAFNIDVKGYKQRNIDTPNNEMIINGPSEAFVENIRTNTSLLRRIINNENLIIEDLSIGKISKTSIAICYMNNIANSNLVNEVKYRLNNIELDSLFSSGQLEQLIQDDENIGIPSILSTERPDKCSKFLMQGRVVILINGNPYGLIVPAVLIDFISSPEDTNLKVLFANFLKTLRLFACLITLLAPRNLYSCYKFSPRAIAY